MSYLGRQPIVGTFVKLLPLGPSNNFPGDAVVNGVNTTFTLRRYARKDDINSDIVYRATSATRLMVVKNNHVLEPELDYVVENKSTIVFTAAPLVTDSIFILGYGQILNMGRPTENSVTDESFAKGSVTFNKLNSDCKDLLIGDIITFGI